MAMCSRSTRMGLSLVCDCCFEKIRFKGKSLDRVRHGFDGGRMKFWKVSDVLGESHDIRTQAIEVLPGQRFMLGSQIVDSLL